VRFDKWTHAHRDNFSHSVFIPIALLALSICFDSKMAIMASVAMLTHPFLDLFGIGWGVKLFYPSSNTTYKMFYQGRILMIWNQGEVDAEAEKNGDDNWIKNTYFKFNVIGAIEWLLAVGFLFLIIVN
jgi:hypothetical protein